MERSVDLCNPHWLSDLMDARGVAPKALAEATGINQSTIKRINAGDISPRIVTVAILLRHFGFRPIAGANK